VKVKLKIPKKDQITSFIKKAVSRVVSLTKIETI
jgi:hypothetical protein